jgi:hypothetical protein
MLKYDQVKLAAASGNLSGNLSDSERLRMGGRELDEAFARAAPAV